MTLLRMYGFKFSAAVVALACFLTLPTAHAGLFDDDEARKAILDLRQKLDQNRSAAELAQQRLADEIKKSNEENASLRRSVLDLANQIEQLRAEIARLRGQGEQLARDVSEVQRKQRDAAQGIDDRLRKIEPVRVGIDGREFMAEPDEKKAYEAALAVFRGGDFAAAQVQWLDFNRRFPTSGYAPSALFWLGNAQYGTKNYREAIGNFRELLRVAPEHARAAESLLSIANCQSELKDVRAARLTLTELIGRFPDSEAGVTAKDRLAKLR